MAIGIEALARREHENMIEALLVAASDVEGAATRRADGVVLIATGLPLRLFNQVLVEGDEATADGVAAAVEVTRGRGDHFIVSLRSGTDDRFLPLMAELGLVGLEGGAWMPGMALHPLPAPSAGKPPGFEIRQVTTAEGLEDHIRTAAGGFEMPDDWLRAVVTEALLARPGTTLYVGHADGTSVTTGLGIRTGSTIGVYNISTVPSARGRGYGAAMTMRIIADGAAAGCETAILQASEMGRPIYERLGFRKVVDYLGFVDPSSLPAPT